MNLVLRVLNHHENRYSLLTYIHNGQYLFYKNMKLYPMRSPGADRADRAESGYPFGADSPLVSDPWHFVGQTPNEPL